MPKRKFIVGTAIFTALIMLMSVSAFAGWKKDSNGIRYENPDGSVLADGFYMIGDKFYVFDPDGYAYKDTWVNFEDGTWAYCSEDYSVATDCWVGMYYVGTDGIMLTDSYTPDGYYVGPDGRVTDPPEESSENSAYSLKDIPYGYYNSVGFNGDTTDYRVDAWINDEADGPVLEFGHYEPEGSDYTYNDKKNPSGDTLVLFERSGQIYGESIKDGELYKLSFDGSKLTLNWKSTSWNNDSDIITLKLKANDSKEAPADDKDIFNIVADDNNRV